ncbi:MAG: polyphosphate polymerase domain-containing protein [Deltaproteobacteria bacterium]|nr:polyphosphate polymerase domain-containing protein [Deltaproteobacteria bacterium]
MRASTIPPRREFKYLLTPDQVVALEAQLQPWCALDENLGPTGTYPIRSLYLDTFDLRLYHANDLETHDRFKVRVRTYPSTPDLRVYLEIKRRTGDVIRKWRRRISPERWAEVAAARGAPTVGVDDPVAPFSNLCLRHALEPKVLVQYERRAWMGRFEAYARVSVDTQIRAQAAERWSLGPQPSAWRALDAADRTRTWGSISVLELKFGERAPSWMVSLVDHLGLSRQAYSKYGHGVDECYAPTLSRAPAGGWS